jgi:hypothetical protein
MHEVTMAFGGDCVQFLDNRNRQVTKIEPLRTDPEEHIKRLHLHYDCHTNSSKIKSFNKADYQSVTIYFEHRI